VLLCPVIITAHFARWLKLFYLKNVVDESNFLYGNLAIKDKNVQKMFHEPPPLH